MTTLSGLYYMDGKDLWDIFRIFVEDGSSDFLKYAARKESIEHDWKDSNGIDIDTSQPFFDPRDIRLDLAIIVSSEAEFWQKYHAFITDLMKPGERRIEVSQFTGQSFYVIYKECTNFDRFTRIKDTNKIACKFTLVLTEPKPQIINDTVFIIDEEGRFLVS